MKPVFIYFREVPFNDNNKFVLDFSDEEFVQRVYFSKKTDYYIASLDCNLILKEYIKKDKEKMIEELSARSRLLLQKGAAYQNDIGWLTSATAGYYNFPGFGVTYNFITYPKIIDEYSYKYKFYDTKMKRITDCKIYSPFSHFKGILVEWRKLVPKVEGYLMPFIVCRTSRRRIDIGITRKKIFLMPPRELRAQTNEGILKNYKYLDRFVLTEANTKQLQAMCPGFCFTFLEKFVRLPHTRHIDFFG